MSVSPGPGTGDPTPRPPSAGFGAQPEPAAGRLGEHPAPRTDWRDAGIQARRERTLRVVLTQRRTLSGPLTVAGFQALKRSSYIVAANLWTALHVLPARFKDAQPTGTHTRTWAHTCFVCVLSAHGTISSQGHRPPREMPVSSALPLRSRAGLGARGCAPRALMGAACAEPRRGWSLWPRISR